MIILLETLVIGEGVRYLGKHLEFVLWLFVAHCGSMSLLLVLHIVAPYSSSEVALGQRTFL